MKNVKKYGFIVGIIGVFASVFIMTASGGDAGLWLGVLDKEPEQGRYETGSMYYDKELKALKECTDASVPSWEVLEGECVYERFITVSIDDKTDFCGKDSIGNAVASVKDASAGKRYGIIILPGDYDTGERMIKCGEYVDLIGINRNSSRIRGRGKYVIKAANNSGIIRLAIENKKGGGILCKNVSSFSYIADCLIETKGAGIECRARSDVNISDCWLKSSDRYGLLLREHSSAGVYNSVIQGRGFGLMSFSSSSFLYDSTIESIYLSKDAGVEIPEPGKGKYAIKGEKGSKAYFSSKDPAISISPEVKILRIGEIDTSGKVKKGMEEKVLKESRTAEDYERKFRNEIIRAQNARKCSACKRDTLHTITVDEAYEKWRSNPKGVVFIDVRSLSSYEIRHIKGAVSIPSWEIGDRVADIPRDKYLIIYCQEESCNYSNTVANQLMFLGFTNVRNMKEGIEIWAKKGYPVVKGPVRKKGEKR